MITRYKSFSALLILLCGLMTAGCQTKQAPPTEDGFQDVNVAEFKELMKGRDVVVLDVRTPEETAQGMIEGAREIDFRGADFRETVDQLDKDKTYLVYCKSGGRSSSASAMMEEMGFERVYNLVGGYTAWSQSE